MNYELISNRLHLTRRDIIAMRQMSKRRYGSKENWPADVSQRFEYLKRCAADLGELVGEDIAA